MPPLRKEVAVPFRFEFFCSRFEYADLPDEQLAVLLGSGSSDTDARDEVRRRYWPLASAHAREFCRSSAHRMGRCEREDCSEAYGAVFEDYLEWFAGRPATGARRPRTSLLVTWSRWRLAARDRADVTFGQYVARVASVAAQGLRVWNRDRGLPQRCRPTKGMAQAGAWAWQTLLAARPELGVAASALGLDGARGLWRVAEALFVDACQAGLTDPIDVPRVTRFLAPKPAEQATAEPLVALLAYAVDDLIARAWGEWHHQYLDRPRQHTRRSVGDPERLHRSQRHGTDGRGHRR